MAVTDSSPISEGLDLFIVQLLVIVLLSRGLAYVFRFIKQPQVIAEVLCGIMLGPSVLGNIPGYVSTLFPDASLNVLNVVSNIGLVFFMFIIGVELDPALLRNNAKQSIIIAISSMVVPFAFGSALSVFLITTTGDHQPPFTSFLLFVGVAMSITAFPVLARILSENRLMTSKVGLIALSSAAVNDVFAWILLAVVVAIARASSSLSALYTFLMLLAYLTIMYLAVRPLLNKLARKAGENDAIKHQVIVIILLMTLLSAWVTDIIGIHAIFGGFVMGILTPRENDFAMYITERIEDVVVILLLPLYFTYSGLRTNLNSINTGEAWGICILVIVITCIGKIGGTLIATKFLKNSWRESLTVGLLMNTKGLVELIVLNLGLDVGVLTPQLFTTFVLMALVTTMITSPSVHFLWTRWERSHALDHIASGEGKFSILLCMADRKVGLAMTTLAAAFIPTTKKSRKKFKATALHLKEVTDQPSTFMISHTLTTFLPFVQERALTLNLPLKIVELASADIADDITLLAKQKQVDLVLLGWNEPLFGSGGSKVRSVLENIDACVGVLVDRGLEIKHGMLSNILLYYTGHPYQQDALKFCRRISRHEGTKVTVVSNLDAEQVQGVVSGCFQFIHSDDPLHAAIEESKRQYNLMILGIDRLANDDAFLETSHLISLTGVSLLLVHSKDGNSLEEKTRLVLNIDDALFAGVPENVIHMEDYHPKKDLDLQSRKTPLSKSHSMPKSQAKNAHQLAKSSSHALSKSHSKTHPSPSTSKFASKTTLSMSKSPSKSPEVVMRDFNTVLQEEESNLEKAVEGIVLPTAAEIDNLKQFLQTEGGFMPPPSTSTSTESTPFRSGAPSGTATPLIPLLDHKPSGSKPKSPVSMSRSVSVNVPGEGSSMSKEFHAAEQMKKSRSIPHNIDFFDFSLAVIEEVEGDKDE